jgi:hypothetical protein
VCCRAALAHAGGVTSAPPVAALPRALQLLLVALAATGTSLSAVATLLAVRFTGVACVADATAHQVWSGQRALLGVVLVALLPWGVAASRTAPHTRGRVRLLVGAAVCAAPPVLALMVGLDHGFWQAGLCG